MTIKDLAIKTGYSVGTVSRALNNQPNVNPETRNTILAAAQECGFRLNENAKRLKQTRSTTIVVVVKGTGNELFGAMVEQIQALIAETPYHLVVDYTDEDSNEVALAIRLCLERKPLGVLFLGASNQNFLEEFQSIDIPCVVITNNASELPFENLSSVSTDDREAARRAVELLISLGHREIAIIGGDRFISDTSRLRYEGCIQALQDHHIPFNPEQAYQSGRYSYQDGYRAASAFLENGVAFTAMFAMADVMAIGAIRALWEHGLRVPEDVSVVGFDGLPLGGFLVPQLTTISQSASRLATRGLEILLEAIEHGTGAIHETVPFTIRRRESIRDIQRQGAMDHA